MTPKFAVAPFPPKIRTLGLNLDESCIFVRSNLSLSGTEPHERGLGAFLVRGSARPRPRSIPIAVHLNFAALTRPRPGLGLRPGQPWLGRAEARPPACPMSQPLPPELLLLPTLWFPHYMALCSAFHHKIFRKKAVVGEENHLFLMLVCQI